ncbi:MAG: methyltransferase domain-containing protein [Paludibacter sp.]|nr:methyltransferase domain-containing protein [Paludibacter sp.]
MKDWLNGIPYEIAFWSSVFKNKKSRNNLLLWSQNNCTINNKILNLEEFLSSTKYSTVLDVGCGMSFRTKYILKNYDVNLQYIDPLADYFNKIAIKNKVNVPNIQFGMLEYLSAFYPAKNISLIFIFNALDHSQNPIKGLFECIEILKIGGIIYLQHHNNEAETESYRGFHKFNITIDENQLIIWNKKNRYNINELFTDFAEVITDFTGDEPTAIIKKTKNTSKISINDDDDKRFLCENLINFTKEMSSLSFVLKYHIKLRWYFFIHFVFQYLSFDFKRKIKRAIRKIK